jgi:hypothetical protein
VVAVVVTVVVPTGVKAVLVAAVPARRTVVVGVVVAFGAVTAPVGPIRGLRRGVRALGGLDAPAVVGPIGRAGAVAVGGAVCHAELPALEGMGSVCVSWATRPPVGPPARAVVPPFGAVGPVSAVGPPASAVVPPFGAVGPIGAVRPIGAVGPIGAVRPIGAVGPPVVAGAVVVAVPVLGGMRPVPRGTMLVVGHAALLTPLPVVYVPVLGSMGRLVAVPVRRTAGALVVCRFDPAGTAFVAPARPPGAVRRRARIRRRLRH